MPIINVRPNRGIAGLTGLLLFLVAGFVHAMTLQATDDSYGVPMGKPLQIEAFGVLENDILDGQSAGENGAMAELLSGVVNGTLSCPTDTTVVLCADGSFDYTPGPGFSGTDSFTYRALFGDVVSAPATVTLTACMGGPDVFSCWQESSYLAMLAELGYGAFVEGFEGAAWEAVRSTFNTTNSAPSITSQGITWTSNHPGTNNITTGEGPARTGMWGGYDPSHGSATDSFDCNVDTPPDTCLFHDGLSGSILPGGTALNGVGGYITGDTGANIAIILDGITQITIGKLPDPGHHFFGVIDARPAGFSGFEFRELDGKIGQPRFIFADDFIIGTSGVVSVNNPPVLDAIGNQVVNEGEPLSILLTASDLDGESLIFSMGGAPTGASLVNNNDGTATFSWTPGFGQAGNYPVSFTVTDNGLPAASDSESITITVGDINRPPVLSPIGNQAVEEGALLSILLTASDPDGDSLSFSMSGAPTGASLVDNGNGTATFSWMPGFGQAGNYPVSFTVTDTGVPAASDSESITVTVGDVNRPPVLSPIGNQAVNEGELLSILLTASDPDGDGWSFSMSGAPTDSSLVDNNDGTATFSWTPDFGETANYPVGFTVTDTGVPAASDSESITITVSVNTRNSVPIANAGADQVVVVGNAVTMDGGGSSDPDGDPLTYSWSLTSQPPGSTVTLSDSTVVNPIFVADVVGAYEVQLVVNDGKLDSLPDTVAITTRDTGPVTTGLPVVLLQYILDNGRRHARQTLK